MSRDNIDKKISYSDSKRIRLASLNPVSCCAITFQLSTGRRTRTEASNIQWSWLRNGENPRLILPKTKTSSKQKDPILSFGQDLQSSKWNWVGPNLFTKSSTQDRKVTPIKNFNPNKKKYRFYFSKKKFQTPCSAPNCHPILLRDSSLFSLKTDPYQTIIATDSCT